ncbi:MAG: transcriptional regulator, partial [Oscillospiraceae bacterium]|nr:transcriptional regulator [Oscillospiraceae bacterium]
KKDLTKALASALEVSPLALDIPDIDSYLGLMHTLFALEDRYGLTIEDRDGEVVFRIDPRRGREAARISEMVYAWAPIAEKYRAGEISKEEYDKWRYNYPQNDNSRIWVKVPSQELGDLLVKPSR